MIFIINLQTIFAAVMVIVALAVIIWNQIKIDKERDRCKHDGRVIETSACHAICTKCGKDLGFIGDYRKTISK